MLLEKRRANNLSQSEVALAVGVSQQAVSLWETGAREPPIDALIKLSELFNCTIDELVKGGEENE